jgi:hypothetical protein
MAGLVGLGGVKQLQEPAAGPGQVTQFWVQVFQRAR